MRELALKTIDQLVPEDRLICVLGSVSMAVHYRQTLLNMSKSTPHWIWHAFLALAFLMACMAAFFYFQSVDEQSIAEARRHLLILGCLIVSLGGLMLWFLRRTICHDWHVSTSREVLPAMVQVNAIGPRPLPFFVRKSLLCLLVLWASWISWSLLIDDRVAAKLTIENGLLQDVTVALYVLATFFFFASFSRTRAFGSQGGLMKWWMLFLSVGCIGVAGEEINWGQSLVQYSTPDFLVRTNIQEEVSLHNIELPGLPGRHWSNAALWVISLVGGAVLPLCLLFSQSVRRLVVSLDVPTPPWTSQAYFLVSALIPPDGALLDQLSRENIPSELREVTVAFAMAVWGLAWWRKRGAMPSGSQHHRLRGDERDEIRTLPV
ncbi:MAG: hypothetical protein K0S45_2462 [Nitrospira sp.]|jgi:hypothetical protein|nr:hypothetical protein [Nitrospira sp.]